MHKALLVVATIACAAVGFPLAAQERVASASKYIVPPTPHYPLRAMAEGLEGYCECRFSVDEQGVPREITVNCTSPEFESAARMAVTQTRMNMKAGIVPGKPIVLPLRFKLSDWPTHQNTQAEENPGQS